MLARIFTDVEIDSHIVHEKRWTPDANEFLLQLLEERRLQLFSPDTEITPIKRLEIWKEIACRMRENGFKQTTASCNKKYSNMRRTYLSNKKSKINIFTILNCFQVQVILYLI